MATRARRTTPTSSSSTTRRSAAIALTGKTLQYRSATGGVGGTVNLAGSVPANSNFLVQMSATGANGAALPTPDQVASPAVNMAAAGGQIDPRDPHDVPHR